MAWDGCILLPNCFLAYTCVIMWSSLSHDAHLEAVLCANAQLPEEIKRFR